MLDSLAFAFGISFVCLLVLVSGPASRFVLDHANERSLHSTPVPRTGGLAIAAGVAGAYALGGVGVQGALLAAAGLAIMSFVDDVISLPVLLRLVMHVAAAVAVLALMESRYEPMLFLALVLGIAWFANVFNFMDGSDGLAAGMSVLGFGACAIAAYGDGVTALAVTCISISAASFAFLLFNFAPARIFMGDSGSIPLGFLAAAVGVEGWREGLWELWFPVLVFSPFLADATLTLAKRLWRREKVWEAHREHYYQRAIRMGFGHRNTALAEYVLMAACAGVALVIRKGTPNLQVISIGLCVSAYCALAFWIDSRWARFGTDKST